MSRSIVRRMSVFAALLVALLALLPAVSHAAPREFGRLYHDGATVRTFGVPAALPHGGTDPLFVVTNGTAGQLGIAQFAPGDREYSGGDWAVYLVTFTTAPYLLMSDEDVRAAQMRGDITVTRAPDRDFRCPVLP